MKCEKKIEWTLELVWVWVWELRGGRRREEEGGVNSRCGGGCA